MWQFVWCIEARPTAVADKRKQIQKTQWNCTLVRFLWPRIRHRITELSSLFRCFCHLSHKRTYISHHFGSLAMMNDHKHQRQIGLFLRFEVLCLPSRWELKTYTHHRIAVFWHDTASAFDIPTATIFIDETAHAHQILWLDTSMSVVNLVLWNIACVNTAMTGTLTLDDD